MNDEHWCWSECCDFGPHACICGNDCKQDVPPPDTWLRRRREEAEFLWAIIRTVAYAIRKRMW